MGSAPAAALAAGLGSFTCLVRGRKRDAAIIATSYATGLVMSEALKRLYGRGRPPRPYRLNHEPNASFPSGHALLSSASYLTITAVISRLLKTKRAKSAALVSGAAATLAAGLSRVYLGVHWASDVLAGWALGAVTASLSWLFAPRR